MKNDIISVRITVPSDSGAVGAVRNIPASTCPIRVLSFLNEDLLHFLDGI
jgi:hypothetical protein